MIRTDRENQFAPGRLWSLLEMMELKLQPFYAATYALASIFTSASSATIEDQFEVDMMKRTLEKLWPELDNLQVGGSSLKKAFERLENSVTLGGNRAIMKDYASSFQKILYDELSGSFFLALSYSERALYDQAEPLFGEDVKNNFPSLAPEIGEIGKCLALGRSTAAAFHMLRCLEAAMRAVSRSLGVPDPTKGTDRNWGNALNAMKGAIDARWPKATRINGDGVLFERLHATLAAMANPYRNATMHLDDKYTPDEARSLLEIVKGYLKSVAARMDEEGLPSA